MKRIYEECTASGVRIDFKTLKTGFMVVFGRAEDSGEGWSERLVDGLVENQKKMLDMMKKDPQISKKELSLKLGISSTAVDKNIITLKKKGLLRCVGPAKGGHWEVVRG